MEINRKELRQTARKQLKGNWLWVIGLLIIPGIINLFLEYITNYVWTGSFNTNNLYLVSWWQGLGLEHIHYNYRLDCYYACLGSSIFNAGF